MSQWWYLIISSSAAPFSSCPQSFSASVFSNELAFHIRWPTYWFFSSSICPSNEYSELIPFRIDWFDLLAVQGTLKRLLQHHSLKASILQCSSLWSSSHIHTWLLGKPSLLPDGPFSAKWCLYFFNMLSRFVIAYLPKSKCLLILWLDGSHHP